MKLWLRATAEVVGVLLVIIGIVAALGFIIAYYPLLLFVVFLGALIALLVRARVEELRRNQYHRARVDALRRN